MPSIERRELQAVATAALAWNRARLRRIAMAKRVPGSFLHPHYGRASQGLADARKEEAAAKARLRKACAAADPASLTIDVECEVIEPVVLLA
ncbi:hypothetical protein [Comamonas badia]|jgi:hypothetical protein|uniref:hypothetical protein n=1 Tax=Comamonas badia TaxID=265291 RepID=UPI000422C899|nr:hypothetical protein [Comamonas badia]